MRLILIRHGESEWNRDDRIMGQADITLNDLGRRQAQGVAEGLQREKLLAVYCSPLKRAMETGRIVATDQGCPLIPDPGLQELGRGNLTGMTRTEAFAAYPELKNTWPQVGVLPGLYGQETLEKLDRRVRESMDRIKTAYASGTVAVVAHYFVNLMVVLAPLRMKPVDFRSFGQDLGAISILEFEKDHSRICLLNDTCHLPKG
jgi:broad specificity phosphatase PhoE